MKDSSSATPLTVARCSFFAAALFAASCGGATAQTAPQNQQEREPSGPAPGDAEASGTAAAARTPAQDQKETSEHASGDFDAIPQKCADAQADGICAPPRPFVQFLCGAYPRPDIALILFSKSSPFTRVYLNRNMEGWYTSGQQSRSAKLLLDEEVVVLSHPKASAGGMVVGNGETNYDVLRIDGVCSSVEPEAISLKRPPQPKYASIPWQQLEKNVKDALLQDPTVAKSDGARRKECKGTTSLGVLSPACAKADDKLSSAIADYVTRGGQTPLPTKR